MKTKLLLTSLLLFPAFGAFAQGYINFSTRATGTVVGHVYGFNWASPEQFQKSGNTATETPPGTLTYAGSLLTGSGYSAQLWYAVGAGQPGGALTLLPGSTTTFRTGSTLGGTPVPTVLQVPGVAPGTGIGTFQVRAWDNQGGTITSWHSAFVRGASAPFEVTNLGDGVLTLPADMANFRSFNIWTPIPEPHPAVLFSLGALGFWLFRRGQWRR